LHDGHYRLQIAPSIRVCPARGTCLADLKAKLWVILCEFFRGDSAFLFLASSSGQGQTVNVPPSGTV